MPDPQAQGRLASNFNRVSSMATAKVENVAFVKPSDLASSIIGAETSKQYSDGHPIPSRSAPAEETPSFGPNEPLPNHFFVTGSYVSNSVSDGSVSKSDHISSGRPHLPIFLLQPDALDRHGFTGFQDVRLRKDHVSRL